MSGENIHIAGRYNKYLRNLSQSPWIDKDDVRVKDSVQELIEDGLKEYLKFDKSIFASSGREDVDVRMLGRGRPFTFKIQNPQLLADFNAENLKKIQSFVNSKHVGKVHIRDLQIVTKSDVSKYLTDTQESKQKEYRALCCCSRRLDNEQIMKINSIKNLVINQVTPIRVLHRRTLSTRQRTIYRMRIEPVNLGEFESLREEHLERVFALVLTTEAGTYIKEFVHGDFGRTKPNLASLLGGNCETDLMELDVMEVYSDWPPSIVDNSQEKSLTGQSHSTIMGNDDKTDKSPEELANLFIKAQKLMQDAQTKPRGDKRQELYMHARHLFEQAVNLMESLNLFSDNENVDDIATVDLKYLLIPAYLAKIMLLAECSPNRLQTFTNAANYMIDFLTRISQYKLGDDAVEEALKSANNNSTILTHTFDRSSNESLELAIRQRNEKIELYKKAKQLDDRLADLEHRMQMCDQSQVDDEVVREFYINLIKKTIAETLDSLEREVKPAIFFERNRSGDQLPDLKQLPNTSVKTKQNLGEPLTIVRDQVQKQIFGIGYPSRPTVTVDEFITGKMTDGSLAFDKHKEIYANSLQRYAEKPNLRREQEEMSDEERETKEDRHDEEELLRKRKWDEFKDDNPSGSGNRHNMG